MVSDTRVRLVDAAWSCVRSKGIAAATSRAITDEADANLGAITYYFGSKDHLLAEACAASIRSLVGPAMRALERDDLDPAARVLEAISLLQQGFTAAGDVAPAYLEMIVHSRHMPVLRRELHVVFTDLRTSLTAAMAAQQADGYLPGWVDPATMAGLFLAVAQGVVLHATVDTAGPSLTAMAGQFAQLLIAARSHTADSTST